MATLLPPPLTRDSLGPIQIPDPPTIPPFPLRPDFGVGVDYVPPLVVHTFDQPGLKTEQRFLMAPYGGRRFRFSKNHLSCTEYDDLKAHWEMAQGAYAQFPYTIVEPGGASETLMVRYENPAIQFDHLIALLTQGPGITFLELPQDFNIYTSVARLTRFPDAVLGAALASEFQQIIPMVTIAPRADPNATLYLSNQKMRLDEQTYLPRMLDWSGISQSIGENSDAASFNFGNADEIFIQYVNQVSLYAAAIQLSLFHVGTNYRIDIWQGYVTNWGFDTSGTFQVNASDGIFQLSLPYPSRKILRTCWKVYKGRFCPSTSDFPDCPKDYDACVARGVPHSFGGIVIPNQLVTVKDNSTGVWGFGRSQMTSVTVVQDTVYQRPLQEIYSDEQMFVTADVAAGRDEGDFFAALGIVGEGPISTFDGNLINQSLDGQPPEDPLHGGGFRGVIGSDPSGANDFVGITQKDPATGSWNVIPPGSTFSGGIAFAEIRRTDQKGLQLTPVVDHSMTVSIIGGIGGWVWNGPGQRDWLPALHNCVWVAINAYLRGIGLRVDPSNQDRIPSEVMELFFDVNAAIEAAAICDTIVPKLIGSGTELQFPFRGVLKEQKPLKDWLREILNCCLGYFTFVGGKLWIGIRVNSSVLAGNAFTRAHVLFKSLTAAPLQPRFNWLVGQFGDEEFGWQLNSVTLYDIDHASFLGTPDSPQYLTNNMNYVGVSNKSQCARLVTTQLREEIGGLANGQGAGPNGGGGGGQDEQLQARNFQFKTTVLALGTHIGDIISITDPKFPNGYMEGRVSTWALNPDFSITIQASCTFDDMYDLVVGPKPTDVLPPPVPPELLPSAMGLAWMPDEVGPFDGDPLYPPWERTFDLWQDYQISKDGVWQPQIWVKGKMTVNRFAGSVQPRILEITLSPGGQLAGGQTVYVAVTQQDGGARPLPPSNLTAIWIPPELSGQQINITAVPPLGDWSGASWSLWAGLDRRSIAHQFGNYGPVPATITFPGPVQQMTIGLPENAAWGIKIAAKHIWHGGICGLMVHSVQPPNQITSFDWLGSQDNWVGRTISIVSNVAGEVPLWNFLIQGFDPASGTVWVTPDCVRPDPLQSVQPGDIIIVHAHATFADASHISDYMWDNSVNRQQFPGSSGLDQAGVNSPNGEIGRIVRILRGKGAGQQRVIIWNDQYTVAVAQPFEVIPDFTSIFIIEAADWPYFTDASELAANFSTEVSLSLPVFNLSDELALVGGFLVDVDGNSTDDAFAVYRMIWIYGSPPRVRIVGPLPGPYQMEVTDQTIRCDTSQSDVVIQLLPIALYEGRTLLIWNDGQYTVHVLCAPGEALFDGNTSVDIFGNQPGNNFLRLTAGSNIVQAPTVLKQQVLNRHARSKRFGEDIYRGHSHS